MLGCVAGTREGGGRGGEGHMKRVEKARSTLHETQIPLCSLLSPRPQNPSSLSLSLKMLLKLRFSTIYLNNSVN